MYVIVILVERPNVRHMDSRVESEIIFERPEEKESFVPEALVNLLARRNLSGNCVRRAAVCLLEVYKRKLYVSSNNAISEIKICVF